MDSQLENQATAEMTDAPVENPATTGEAGVSRRSTLRV